MLPLLTSLPFVNDPFSCTKVVSDKEIIMKQHVNTVIVKLFIGCVHYAIRFEICIANKIIQYVQFYTCSTLSIMRLAISSEPVQYCYTRKDAVVEIFKSYGDRYLTVRI